MDGRKHPIRGLWVRNGRYCAHLNTEDGNTGEKKTRRVPSGDKMGSPIQTTPQPIEEMNRLTVKRSDSDLCVLTSTPTFGIFVRLYLAFITAGEGIKKPPAQSPLRNRA